MQPRRMTAIALLASPSSFTAALVFLIAVLIASSVLVLHHASFLLDPSHDIDGISSNDCKFKIGR